MDLDGSTSSNLASAVQSAPDYEAIRSQSTPLVMGMDLFTMLERMAAGSGEPIESLDYRT